MFCTVNLKNALTDPVKLLFWTSISDNTDISAQKHIFKAVFIGVLVHFRVKFRDPGGNLFFCTQLIFFWPFF